MFRLSHYLEPFLKVSSNVSHIVDSASAKPLPKKHKNIETTALQAPVVIWNLIRSCNLLCQHCYASSTNKVFTGELNTQEVFTALNNLKASGVHVLILSGGEPLMRDDIFDIAAHAKEMGFYVGLSSNGTLMNEAIIEKLASLDLNYIGISLDGIGPTHDTFRGVKGSFDRAFEAMQMCVQAGLKVGARYTMTEHNAHDFEPLLQMVHGAGVHKFYFSHLNYAGRGNHNRTTDTVHQQTRAAIDLLIRYCIQYYHQKSPLEIVTGNNDADAIYLLHWVKKEYPQQLHLIEDLEKQLIKWGGNSSGVNIANIDNRGYVHPDTMWWKVRLGNIKNQPFKDILDDISHPLMAGLKQRPRPVTGRCGHCHYLHICNGNTRVRAWELTGDYWAQDPACYLDNIEIGLDNHFDDDTLAKTITTHTKTIAIHMDPSKIQQEDNVMPSCAHS